VRPGVNENGDGKPVQVREQLSLRDVIQLASVIVGATAFIAIAL